MAVMAQLKRSIVEIKAEENCVAHALVIAVAIMTNDHNYKAYSMGRKKNILPKVREFFRGCAAISAQEEGSLNYRPFSAIFHNIR
jgi:hypothetical protein